MRRSIVLVLVLFGCGDDDTPADSGGDTADSAADSATDALVDTGGRLWTTAAPRHPVAHPETEALAGREGCAFAEGAMPWETRRPRVPDRR